MGSNYPLGRAGSTNKYPTKAGTSREAIFSRTVLISVINHEMRVLNDKLSAILLEILILINTASKLSFRLI